MPASSFTLTTVPDGGGKPMTLELRGRALPYQGLELEGLMRAEITRYPGNAVATVQMLGIDEKPTVVKGMWKDRFIRQTRDTAGGSSVSITNTGLVLFNGLAMADSNAAADAVDLIMFAGQIVRMTWDEVVREGILKRFKRNYIRREDLEWEMEFEWVGRGLKQSPPNVPVLIQVADFGRALTALVNQLKAALQPPAFSVLEEFTSTVSGFVSSIEDASIEIQSAAMNSARKIMSPVTATERAITSINTLKSSASGIVDAVESYPPLALIKTSSTADTEALTFGDSMVADVYARNIKTRAQSIERLAAAEGETMTAENRQSTLLGIFTARQPMDLRDVSMEFFGTSDEWRSLLTYNNLDSSWLAVGQVVIVPKLTTSQRGA